MATNFLWGIRQSATTLLSTDLNSLASGSGSAASSSVDFTSSGYWQLADFELALASSSLAFTASSYVDIYLLPSADGTNYPKYTSGASYKIASHYWSHRIYIHPATLSAEAIVEVAREVRLPSAKFKVVLVNQTGVTLPSSGNTLKLYPTPEQY